MRTPTQRMGQSLASEQGGDSCSSREKRKPAQTGFFSLQDEKDLILLRF